MSRKILIIEDEILVGIGAKIMVEELPGYEVIDIIPDLASARSFLKLQRPDLILLDIHLGNGANGIDFAKELNQLKIPFIFATSYADKETLNLAFLSKPEGYIVKPFERQHLFAALEMAFNKLETQHFITFNDGKTLYQITSKDIIYLHAEKNYVSIFKNDKVHVVRKSLKEILTQLDSRFKQVHKAYVVNMYFISRINHQILLKNGIEIPLSKTYKEELIASFENYRME